jgi:dephospho-CoA kinase
MTFTVGLTGGICSGKSTAAEAFAALGIKVISADQIAKDLLNPDTPSYKQVCSHFGEKPLAPEGKINRKALLQIILDNPKEKSWLEDLLHPLIRNEIQNALKTVTSPYSIIEIPLLYEAKQKGEYQDLDRILLITCPKELQIERLMQRKKLSNTEAIAIIKQQAKDTQRISIANDLLENTETLSNLKQKVAAHHKTYLELSS